MAFQLLRIAEQSAALRTRILLRPYMGSYMIVKKKLGLNTIHNLIQVPFTHCQRLYLKRRGPFASHPSTPSLELAVAVHVTFSVNKKAVETVEVLQTCAKIKKTSEPVWGQIGKTGWIG